MLDGHERIKFDLPLAYTRALRSRAGIQGVYPRDILIEALDAHLPLELAAAREWLAISASESPKPAAKPKKKV